MANNVKFLRGAEASLPKTGVEGYFYLTTDTHKLHVGLDTGAIVCLNQEVIWINSRSELPNYGDLKKLYYVKDENILCYWDNTERKYTQINPDTGVTKVEFSGSGNAVTGAEYDAANRRLILTKGETFATASELSQLETTVENAKPVVYSVSSNSTNIEELSSGITGKPGDMLVVTADNNIKSAYYFDKTTNGWVACDGNVDANAVILSKDIELAGSFTRVGNYKKDSETATATVSAAGLSVQAFITKMLSEEEQGSISSNPAVSVTLSNAGAKEVGTKVTPKISSATLSAGSYKYGPATGVTASSWKLTDTNGNTKDVTGTSVSNLEFSEITVSETTNYKVTAVATHTAGANALTNLKNPSSPEVKIEAGTKSATTSAITGYRNTFYGTRTSKDELTATIIRSLGGKSGTTYSNGSTFSITIPVGTLRVVIAYPATLRNLTSVLDQNDSNSNIVSGFGDPKTISIHGATAGQDAIDYKVYTMDFANPYDTANVFKVTI